MAFSEGIWRDLFKKNMAICTICGIFDKDGQLAHILKDKNLNSIENAIYVCRLCFNKKDDMAPEYLSSLKMIRETSQSYPIKYNQTFSLLIVNKIQNLLLEEKNSNETHHELLPLFEKYMTYANIDNEFLVWLFWQLCNGLYQITGGHTLLIIHLTIDHFSIYKDYNDNLWIQKCMKFIMSLFFNVIHDKIDESYILFIFSAIYKFCNDETKKHIIDLLDDINLVDIVLIKKLKLLCQPQPKIKPKIMLKKVLVN